MMVVVARGVVVGRVGRRAARRGGRCSRSAGSCGVENDFGHG
jgi:hypothetical protein